MQVEDVGDGRVVGCIMSYFKSSTLIWRSAEYSQVSLTQFQIRESTGINQLQRLFILANVGQPKVTISAIVKLEVFGSRIPRIQVNSHFVIENLARIIDVQAKVRYVVIVYVLTIFNYIGSLDWTYDWCPFRRQICLSTAHLKCLRGF